MRKEGSHGSECSKTSLTSSNEDGSESEANEDESKRNINNGGSSSNSTVEENEKKKSSSVRPYVRSKLPRLRWTPDLHLSFINAVQRLGGKEILADHRLLVESGNRNVNNFIQLPMLQGYNPEQGSAYRHVYRDVSSLGVYENMMNSPFMPRSSIDESKAGFYSRMNERIYKTNSNNMNWTNNIFQVDSSNFGELSTSKVHSGSNPSLDAAHNRSFIATSCTLLSTNKVHEQKDEFLSFGNHVKQIRAK